MAKQPDLQVVLPYQTLVELLDASKEVSRLRQDVKRLSDQQMALRGQFTELMERFQELRNYVID